MKPDPKNQRDTNVVSAFTEYSQNTHNEVLNRSIAKALFGLTSLYFPDKEGEELTKAFNLAYETCQQALKKSSQKLNSLDLTNAIEWLIQECEKPPNELDLITAYLPSSKESNSPYQDIQSVFPLKAVLTLVWTALHDHKSYAHNYTNAQSDPLTQATNDLENRLQTFANILISLKRDRLCHTGIRNQLVFSLNGIHKNVNILEDPTAVVMSILREKLVKAYFIQHEALFENPLKQQRVLLVTLFRWIDEGNASPLVKALQITQPLIKELSTLFLAHGINPNSIPVSKTTYDTEEIITENLKSLSFSCGFDQYPLLFKIHEIFQDKLSFTSGISKFPNRTQAARSVKEWLQEDFDLEKNSHCDVISTFYDLYHISDLLQTYSESLVTTGFIEATDYSSVLKSLNTHFENFAEFKNNPPQLNPDQHEQFLSLIKKIDAFKNNALFDTIANFFALYIGPQNKKNVYTLLLKPEIQNKILLTDETLKNLLKPKGNSNEIEVNPYLLNRIILHAIITYNNVEHPWSEDFKQQLKAVIDFIERNFDKKDDIKAASLKRDSYPTELLEQLKYYLDEKQPKPKSFFILLPHQIHTYEDWLQVSELLNPESIQSYEKTILPGILLRSGWQSVHDDNAEKILPEFLKLIPPNQKLIFLKKIPDEKCTAKIWNILHKTLDEKMRKAVYKFKFKQFNNLLWEDHKNAMSTLHRIDNLPRKTIYTIPNDLQDDFIRWLQPKINTNKEWVFALIFASEIYDYNKGRIDELLQPNWPEIQTDLLIYTQRKISVGIPSNDLLTYKKILKIILSTINIEDRFTLMINVLDKIDITNYDTHDFTYYLWKTLSESFTEINDSANLEKIYSHYLKKISLPIWKKSKVKSYKIIPLNCRAGFFLQIIINERRTKQTYLEALLNLFDKYIHARVYSRSGDLYSEKDCKQFANELAEHMPAIIDLIRQEKTEFKDSIAFKLLQHVGPLYSTDAEKWYKKFSSDKTFSIANLAILHQTPQAVSYLNKFKPSEIMEKLPSLDELAMVVREIPDDQRLNYITKNFGMSSIKPFLKANQSDPKAFVNFIKLMPKNNNNSKDQQKLLKKLDRGFVETLFARRENLLKLKASELSIRTLPVDEVNEMAFFKKHIYYRGRKNIEKLAEDALECFRDALEHHNQSDLHLYAYITAKVSPSLFYRSSSEFLKIREKAFKDLEQNVKEHYKQGDVITALELCYDARRSPLFNHHRNEWFEFWRLPYGRTNTVQKIDALIKNIQNDTWETSEQSNKLPIPSSQHSPSCNN